MANNSCSPITQAEESKKQYTTSAFKRSDRARWFQHITGRSVNRILHEVDSNILHNFSLLREYFVMAEDIYRPSASHQQGKTVHQKVYNVDPIVVSNYPKCILDRYKNVPLCCDIMQTKGIGFLNTISWHILFALGSMIKNREVKNIEDEINRFNKLYIQRGFKTTRIYADSEFEPLRPEMADIGISLNFVSNKEHVPDIE